MIQVLSGFFVVVAIVATGTYLSRRRILGDNAGPVLSRLVFSVGLPTMLFTNLTTMDLGAIFGITGLIALITAIAVMVIAALAAPFFRWNLRSSIVGMMCVGFLNATNLGVPLATYIFGDVSTVTSIMLFQVAILTPIALTILDITTPGADTGRARAIFRPLTNPVVIAALLGLTIGISPIEVPDLALEPIRLLSQVTVPVMLLVFGMSLTDLSLGAAKQDRAPLFLLVVLKSVIQPLLAWLTAGPILHLEPSIVFIAVSCAMLPTGQNVVIYALRYDVESALARTTAAVTTAIAAPSILCAALIFPH